MGKRSVQFTVAEITKVWDDVQNLKPTDKFTLRGVDSTINTIKGVVSERLAMVPKTINLDGLEENYAKLDIKSQIATCLPFSNAPVYVDMVKVMDVDGVQFKRTKGGPMSNQPVIMVALNKFKLKPNHGVRINLGYQLIVPPHYKTAPQPSCVIVMFPQTNTSGTGNIPGIVPSIVAYDSSEGSLLTLNLTTTDKYVHNPKSGVGNRIAVQFAAFESMRFVDVLSSTHYKCSPETVEDIVRTNNKEEIFKGKDKNDSRHVRTLKVKLDVDSEEMLELDGGGVVSYNTPGGSSIHCHLPMKFFSRRREWLDPELVTLTKFYSKNDLQLKDPKIEKYVYGSSAMNTHSVAFFKSRLQIQVSENTLCMKPFHLLSGAFKNVNGYDVIRKYALRIYKAFEPLEKMWMRVRNMEEKERRAFMEQCDHDGKYSNTIIENPPQYAQWVSVHGRALSNVIADAVQVIERAVVRTTTLPAIVEANEMPAPMPQQDDAKNEDAKEEVLAEPLIDVVGDDDDDVMSSTPMFLSQINHETPTSETARKQLNFDRMDIPTNVVAPMPPRIIVSEPTTPAPTPMDIAPPLDHSALIPPPPPLPPKIGKIAPFIPESPTSPPLSPLSPIEVEFGVESRGSKRKVDEETSGENEQKIAKQ